MKVLINGFTNFKYNVLGILQTLNDFEQYIA